ncbi:hypothetical protein CLV80_104319 [Yoonia maritima]|uniref:Uncharacterized protein n=1 Tax=Yoonia maritima TaxID=1435347 RepID=A0A2T0W0P8_9RHOB|nr:hypothetical protein CLV80_104319 [Yoonia maritima]
MVVIGDCYAVAAIAGQPLDTCVHPDCCGRSASGLGMDFLQLVGRCPSFDLWRVGRALAHILLLQMVASSVWLGQLISKFDDC